MLQVQPCTGMYTDAIRPSVTTYTSRPRLPPTACRYAPNNLPAAGHPALQHLSTAPMPHLACFASGALPLLRISPKPTALLPSLHPSPAPFPCHPSHPPCYPFGCPSLAARLTLPNSNHPARATTIARATAHVVQGLHCKVPLHASTRMESSKGPPSLRKTNCTQQWCINQTSLGLQHIKRCNSCMEKPSPSVSATFKLIAPAGHWTCAAAGNAVVAAVAAAAAAACKQQDPAPVTPLGPVTQLHATCAGCTGLHQRRAKQRLIQVCQQLHNIETKPTFCTSHATCMITHCCTLCTLQGVHRAKVR